jgi:hypothetical protein
MVRASSGEKASSRSRFFFGTDTVTPANGFAWITPSFTAQPNTVRAATSQISATVFALRAFVINVSFHARAWACVIEPAP